MVPQISVVIVSRDKLAMLSKAVERLAAQSFPKSKFEVIIVDDRSEKDGLSSLTGKFRRDFSSVRVVRQGKLGLSAGRNLGAKSARSGIVAFTDNDCLPEKDWLRNIASKFKDPQVIGVEGKITTDYPRKLFTSAPENLSGGRFTGANTAYRKEIIEKAGYYDEKIGFWREDSEFAFRAMQFGKIAFAEDAVVYHPLRKDPPHSSFRYLFFLRNEWACILRHPSKSFFIFTNLCKELLKSVCAVLFFLSSVSLFLMFGAPTSILFFSAGILGGFALLISTLVLSGKYAAREIFSQLPWLSLFFAIALIKYLSFPAFLIFGFFTAVPLARFNSGGEK